MKRLIIGMFLFALVAVPAVGSVYASTDDSKPWESLSQFRGGEVKDSAKSLGMDRDEFFAYRNELREEHRERRMMQKEKRLLEAVDRGCLDPEDIKERLQERRGRFSVK